MDTFENQNTEFSGNEPEQETVFFEDVWDAPVEPVEPVPEQPIPDPVQQPARNTPVNPAPQYDAFPPKKTKKKSGGGFKKLIAILVAFALVICTSAITASVVGNGWRTEKEAMTKSFEERLQALRKELEDKSYVGSGDSISGTPNVTPDGSLTPAQVYAKNVNSVVVIARDGKIAGTGFVLTADGYVATNYHVVEGARTVKISCYDGKEYSATYVGGDQTCDVAVLKVEASDLKPVTLGRSDHLIVGDQVVAIGNPLGELTYTMTVGYVSAKDRTLTTNGMEHNAIQTDVAINQGNSGGPLFNMKGEVVGITNIKLTGSSIEGLGFAVPIDDVAWMMNDLIEKGYVSGAYLGVSVEDVTQWESQRYGLPLGVWITTVSDGSGAQKAGIRVNDILTNLGGHAIKSESDLARALRNFKSGDTISCTVFRIQTGEVAMTVTLGEKPAPEQEASVPTQGQIPSGGSAQDWFDYFG